MIIVLPIVTIPMMSAGITTMGVLGIVATVARNTYIVSYVGFIGALFLYRRNYRVIIAIALKVLFIFRGFSLAYGFVAGLMCFTARVLQSNTLPVSEGKSVFPELALSCYIYRSVVEVRTG